MVAALGRQVGQFVRRLEVQDAVRGSDARKAAMLESALDAVVSMDHRGRIVDFNPAAERMFGLPRDRAVGREMAGLIIPPRLRDAHRRALDRYLSTGQPSVLGRRVELSALRADGTEFPVEVAITRVRGAGPPLFTGYIRDITERRRAEEERALLLDRERAARARAEVDEERLAFVAEASRILAGSLDYSTTLARVADLAVPRIADWCVVDLVEEDGSVRMMALAHRDPERVRLVRELRRRHPPDPRAPVGVHAAVRTGEPVLVEEISDDLLAAVARDPEHLAAVRELGLGSGIIVPLPGHAGPLGAISLLSSESHRRFGPEEVALAEELARRAGQAIENARLFAQVRTRAEEIERLNAELERRVAERTAELEAANRELEAFSYSVSHDLRAPLRAMDGFSRIVLTQYAGEISEEARRYLELVREGAQQMGRLIDDLLAFARLSRQPLVRQEVDLERLVRQCFAELAEERSGRAVDLTVLPLRPCTGDPALLKQVVSNLLSNALKYTRARPEARIEVGGRETDGGYAYYVADNGVGFDMRYAGKLFGVFQRLHRVEDYEGTGVGLATVQRIVHRHGGRVWAEAAPDRGATFLFTLGEGP
jgi:PAS domain S-box-containing protein